MSSKNAKNEKKENNGGWKILIQTFVANALARVSDNITAKASVWIKNFKKMVLGSVLAFIGLVFFLIAVALFINATLQNKWPWAGYAVVGIVIIAVGYIIGKRKKSN